MAASLNNAAKRDSLRTKCPFHSVCVRYTITGVSREVREQKNKVKAGKAKRGDILFAVEIKYLGKEPSNKA